jgi:hypothetical protein
MNGYKQHMRIIKFSYLILFWIVLVPFKELTSQSIESTESIVNNQIWFYFISHFYINEKLEYYGDSGYRTVLREDGWHRIYARPSVRYHISKLWEVQGGIGFFYSFNELISDRFEIRPWQGIKLNWPRFEKILFNHLIRFEERFSFRTNDWQSSFEFRMRYKLAGRLDIIKAGPDSFWFIPFYAEIFVSVIDEIEEIFRDLSRAGVGLGYNESNNWRFEFLFNWQTSRSRPNDELVVTDYLYQIKIRRLVNFTKIINF